MELRSLSHNQAGANQAGASQASGTMSWLLRTQFRVFNLGLNKK